MDEERMLPKVGKSKNYIEHAGKAVETDERFKHVMAITLDPRSDYREGIIRCITSREGDVQVKGYRDRSVLHKVRGSSLERFEIGERLKIKNEERVVNGIGGEDWGFIGLEDPDIWIDDTTNLMHVYFTMPLFHKKQDRALINLGHAVGKDLDSLEMTMPVLMPEEKGIVGGAKEVSIAPLNRQGFRYNLIESAERGRDFWYQVIRMAVAEDMGKSWQYGPLVFHPAEHHIPWIGGHASPGPLLPRTFIDVGESKALGILNGREENQRIGKEIRYGMFSVGLFIYDYENGKMEWISPQPFIQDTQAKTITFASQFVETGRGSGILYAHVDDSFVRAYTLSTDSIKLLLP